jgi:hypothetical protein
MLQRSNVQHPAIGHDSMTRLNHTHPEPSSVADSRPRGISNQPPRQWQAQRATSAAAIAAINSHQPSIVDPQGSGATSTPQGSQSHTSASATSRQIRGSNTVAWLFQQPPSHRGQPRVGRDCSWYSNCEPGYFSPTHTALVPRASMDTRHQALRGPEVRRSLRVERRLCADETTPSTEPVSLNQTNAHK